LVTLEWVVIVFIINNLSPVYTPKKDAPLGKFREFLGKYIPILILAGIPHRRVLHQDPDSYFFYFSKFSLCLLNNLVFMSETKVVVLQSSDTKKLEAGLTDVLRGIDRPLSITQSQSAVPVIGSRMGWENIITITVVYPE